MQCFIYKSLRKQHVYLYLGKKDDFSTVPAQLFESLGKMEFVFDLELAPERKLANADAATVMASLVKKGYFLQLPPAIMPAPLKPQ